MSSNPAPVATRRSHPGERIGPDDEGASEEVFVEEEGMGENLAGTTEQVSVKIAVKPNPRRRGFRRANPAHLRPRPVVSFCQQGGQLRELLHHQIGLPPHPFARHITAKSDEPIHHRHRFKVTHAISHHDDL